MSFFLLTGCTSSTGLQDREVLAERIFAPATAAEVEAVTAQWAERRPAAEGVRVERNVPVQIGVASGTVRIVSHLVDGYRHYGAIVVPAGKAPASLPILVYAHGGDAGVSLTEIYAVLALLGPRAADLVLVAPSFRAEPMIVGASRFDSEGDASPWDRDVDDALALVDVAIAHAPETDPARIGVLGISRGGGVGLLMAVRDPRIALVIEFFGPTDFFGPYVRGVVEEALEGGSRDLPGFAVLNRRFIQPLSEGTVSLEQFRLELVRRSAVLFTDRLPPVQIHHGTADSVVAVSQAEALRDALRIAARDDTRDETFIYPGAGHALLHMPAAPGRVISFIERHLLP